MPWLRPGSMRWWPFPLRLRLRHSTLSVFSLCCHAWSTFVRFALAATLGWVVAVLLVLPRCALGVPSAALTCMVTTCFARAVRPFAPPAFVMSWDRAMWSWLLSCSVARICCAAVLFVAVTRALVWAFPRQTCRFPTEFRCLPMACMRAWCSSMTPYGLLPLTSACRRRMPTMPLHRISRLT